MTMAVARHRHVTGFAPPLAYTTKVCAAAAATIAVWLLVRQDGAVVQIPVLGATFVAGLVVAGPLRPAEVRALVRMLRPRRAR